MEITINTIGSRDVNGDGSDVITTYLVSSDEKEFTITSKSNFYGRSFGLIGEEGTLHIDSENNKVYRQKVALGGGCGLLIDDIPVEGLSPWALRGILVAEHSEFAREITIRTGQLEDCTNQPLLLIDGIVKNFRQYSDVFGDIA